MMIWKFFNSLFVILLIKIYVFWLMNEMEFGIWWYVVMSVNRLDLLIEEIKKKNILIFLIIFKYYMYFELCWVENFYKSYIG